MEREPDELRPQVYSDPRPPESMTPYHQWARTHEPGWTYPATRVVLTPIVLAIYRTKPIGRGNVPAEGPVIIAPNHFSNMDHFFCGVWLRRQIRFMGKSQFFGNNAALTYLFKVAGHFPVRRGGGGDEEAFITAHSILDRGGCVGMYAEGGRSRTGGLGEPRAGIGRLALESGVPVVPVAIHSLGVRGWKRGRFPRVTVAYGAPIVLDRNPGPSREQQLEAAQLIFTSVRELYQQLERAAKPPGP
jgi:1-acyl-sn-glycerol-3-phosphate acyltransferase